MNEAIRHSVREALELLDRMRADADALEDVVAELVDAADAATPAPAEGWVPPWTIARPQLRLLPA